MLKNKAVNDIGNKFEEAYLSKEFQEAPSDETIAKWIAIAELRREERRRRNRKLVSLASILLICICVGVTCTIKHPRAVAGSSGGNRVESGMETIDVYTSYDEIPDDIKSDFLMFEHVPKEYSLKEIIVRKFDNMEKITLSYSNTEDREITIEEVSGKNEEVITNIINRNDKSENWYGIDIYISSYGNNIKQVVYSFVIGNVIVEIKTDEIVLKKDIKMMVKELLI